MKWYMQPRQGSGMEFLQDNEEEVWPVYFTAHLEPSVDAFGHHIWELYLHVSIPKKKPL